tara:strand:+ start:109 stop:789 length:681 start_codon:yes stop_codon:yes gene_type:complete
LKNTILLTGNKGLIGKSLEDYLIKKDFKVKGFDIESNLTLENNVKKIMQSNDESEYLINAFALNDHINKESRNYDPLNFPLTEFRDFLEINNTTLFSVCREFIKTRNKGSIINFSSIYGFITPDPKIYDKKSPKHIGYPTSKSAVISISNYLAIHYAPNFRVNTLAIGGILNNQPNSFKDKYASKVPLNRMMNLEELFPAISFLLDPKNTYMTGSTLLIDGGYSII